MTDQPPPQTLAARLGEGLRAGWSRLRAPGGEPSPRRNWWVAGGVAALIACGPLATILGGNLLAAQASAEARALEAKAAPRIAAGKAATEDRQTLAAVLRRPGLGQVIEALSRAMPADASLAHAERGSDGLLAIEINTTDPDRLRDALRHDPLLAALRDSGQRQGDAGMTVSLKEAP